MNALSAWCAALLDPRRTIPASLVTWNGSDPVQRFAVYRNNVTVSLMQALADTFPVTLAVVGDLRFRDLARAFVRTQPPRSPVLAGYGRGFAAFVADHEAAARWPCLPDLARLELVSMSVGDCRFVGALQTGATLGAATVIAADPGDGTDAGFDLTRCLAVLLREQVVTGITIATRT